MGRNVSTAIGIRTGRAKPRIVSAGRPWISPQRASHSFSYIFPYSGLALAGSGVQILIANKGTYRCPSFGKAKRRRPGAS
jgi:hypothetical protein